MQELDSKNIFECYCAEIPETDKQDIRENVCSNELFKEIYGKSYCVLHFPNPEKWGSFWRAVNLKIKEKNFDFRYVWFPNDNERKPFDRFDFNSLTDFSNAVFAEDITFTDAKFDKVDFLNAQFRAKAIFTNSEFRENVSFFNAEFSDAEFNSAKFNKETNFEETKFIKNANFYHADFVDFAVFTNAEFAQANFSEAFFSGLNFKDAKFGFVGPNLLNKTPSANFKNATFGENKSGTARYFAKNLNIFSAKFFIDADFSESVFHSQASFADCTFYKNAEFVATVFKNKVDFNSCNFNGIADFRIATFLAETKFEQTIFGEKGEAKFFKSNFEKDTFFDFAEFRNDVSFNSTIFGKDSDIIFRKTLFAKYVSFRYAHSEGILRFIDLKQGDKNWFKFDEAVFEKTNRVAFHNARLQPYWFVNINSSKFIFNNCCWEQTDGSKILVENELKNLDDKSQNESKDNKDKPKSHSFLITTFRQLAENAENNSRFELASKFRQMAFEVQRIERNQQISKWWEEEFSCGNFILNFWKKLPSVPYDFAHFAYRWTSSYGENWGWAISVLLFVVLFIFPVIYIFTDFKSCAKDRPISVSLSICENTDSNINKKCTCNSDPISITDSITQSLMTATLQNVEYRKPMTSKGELWLILEKIFAPLQAALLALAIRRKFMR